jgi:hypothetical protein
VYNIIYTCFEKLNNIASDLMKKELKGWKEKMMDREKWRPVLEGNKAHPGL